MKKTLFLLPLIMIIVSGCIEPIGKKHDILTTDSRGYNLGDNIQVCLETDPTDVVLVTFWLKQLNTDKSDSQITWDSSNEDIQNCYDLEQLKWSKSFSSVATDSNLDFYQSIGAGEYSLKANLASPDGDSFKFTDIGPIFISIK
jgi:hypothetical protein